MSRKMRRFKQQMSDDECIAVLEQEPRGVLSVHGEDGYPYGVPMDFIYDDGKIYFHSAKAGHKIDALRADDKVSFCVFEQGYPVEGDRGLYVKSVVIFGRVAFVDDHEKTVEKARKLGLKYFPDDPDYIESELKNGDKALQVLELSIDEMRGKLVHEA